MKFECHIFHLSFFCLAWRKWPSSTTAFVGRIGLRNCLRILFGECEEGKPSALLGLLPGGFYRVNFLLFPTTCELSVSVHNLYLLFPVNAFFVISFTELLWVFLEE